MPLRPMAFHIVIPDFHLIFHNLSLCRLIMKYENAKGLMKKKLIN